MQNIDIRIMVSEKGIHYRDIAKCMGVTPEYLSRLMQKQLSQTNQERILDAIEEVQKRADLMSKNTNEEALTQLNIIIKDLQRLKAILELKEGENK